MEISRDYGWVSYGYNNIKSGCTVTICSIKQNKETARSGTEDQRNSVCHSHTHHSQCMLSPSAINYSLYSRQTCFSFLCQSSVAIRLATLPFVCFSLGPLGSSYTLRAVCDRLLLACGSLFHYKNLFQNLSNSEKMFFYGI